MYKVIYKAGVWTISVYAVRIEIFIEKYCLGYEPTMLRCKTQVLLLRFVDLSICQVAYIMMFQDNSFVLKRLREVWMLVH